MTRGPCYQAITPSKVANRRVKVFETTVAIKLLPKVIVHWIFI